MSWVSDSLEGFYEQQTRALKRKFAARDLISPFDDSFSKVQDILTDEYNKADLRGAEITTFLRGLPLIGGVVGGIEGIQQLEDLYKNTGKVPAYPGSSGPGAQGLAQAGVGVARKIEDGLNDLGEYYAGDPSLNDSVNVNGRTHYPTVYRGTGKISKYGGF